MAFPRSGLLVLLVTGMSATLVAQSPGPAFEVASVKRAEPGKTGARALGATASCPSIFTAVREQLGLRLDAQLGPVDVLVIDAVQFPTEN